MLVHSLAEDPSPVPGGISDARIKSIDTASSSSSSTARGISSALSSAFIAATSCQLSKRCESDEVICMRPSLRSLNTVYRAAQNSAAKIFVIRRQVGPFSGKTDP